MSSLQKDFLKSKLSKLPQLPALRDPLADASEGDDTSPDSLLEDDEDEDGRDGLGELEYVPWSTSTLLWTVVLTRRTLSLRSGHHLVLDALAHP